MVRLRLLSGEMMVNRISLLPVNLQLPSHIFDFTPEAVAKSSHRRSEQLGNFLPVVASRSEGETVLFVSLSLRTMISKSNRAFT
jgi:hypothetical protein